mmetsp:Transcript_9335/g.28129  ORF Transcript_9335/g.28129 Transcript_9335/m.28129 type:complete len:130 (-) Transcript_9335:281-670(-)
MDQDTFSPLSPDYAHGHGEGHSKPPRFRWHAQVHGSNFHGDRLEKNHSHVVDKVDITEVPRSQLFKTDDEDNAFTVCHFIGHHSAEDIPGNLCNSLQRSSVTVGQIVNPVANDTPPKRIRTRQKVKNLI